MGYRAYVMKAGSTEEDNGSDYFNNRSHILLELFNNHNVEYENDFRLFREKWTIKDTELNALIAILEKSPNEIDECFSEEMDLAMPNHELADDFRNWLKHADKESGLIRIHWS